MKRIKSKSAASHPSEKPSNEKKPAAPPTTLQSSPPTGQAVSRLQDAKRLLEQLTNDELQGLFQEILTDPVAPLHRQVIGLFVPLICGQQIVRVHHEDMQTLLSIIGAMVRDRLERLPEIILEEKHASYEAGEANGRNWMEQRKQDIFRLSTKEGMSAQSIADKLNEELRRNPALVRARAFVDKDGKNGVDDMIADRKMILTKEGVLKILKAMNNDPPKNDVPRTFPKKKRPKKPK